MWKIYTNLKIYLDQKFSQIIEIKVLQNETLTPKVSQ